MTVAPPEPATASDAQEVEVKKTKKGGPAHELFELVKTVVYALLIALVLRVLLFQPFTIPSASMEPTLLEGDYIIVSKFAYGWSKASFPNIIAPPAHGRLMGREPHRGDIIVFKLPRDGKTDYIKRLIGLPGDRIQVTGGLLSINGKPVTRVRMTPVELDTAFGVPHAVDRFREVLPDSGGKSFTTYSFGPDGEVDNTGVYIVPAGHYFMMGDNRDNSVDSRYPTETGVGFVPAENLVGRAEIILFSWNQGASLFRPWTWITEARPSRWGQRLQ
jgi:signal peptidase I